MAVESVLVSAGALYKERGQRVELLLVDDASSDASSYFFCFFLELLLVETRPATSCVRRGCGRI